MDSCVSPTSFIVRVTAPHYCAGFEVHDGICWRAAPILKWVNAKQWTEVLSYLQRKGYEVLTQPL